MIEMLGENGALVAIGFLSGIVLGVAARWGRFCTLGALEDWHYGGSSVRFRMWGVALGAAIISVFALALAGWLDLGGTLYLSQSPGVVAAGLGGLLFGVGMALAGNCGFGALARLGGGELRSLVIVMVMGVAALATASGPLAELRVALVPPMPATPCTIDVKISGTMIMRSSRRKTSARPSTQPTCPKSSAKATPRHIAIRTCQ